MGKMEHWEHMYATKKPTEVSWYRPHLEVSLRLITKANPDRAARIIDVGGGESTLVDDLLALGYRDVSVLDLSEIAIQTAKKRLGADAGRVTWLHADLATYAFAPHSFDVWHDRAVFHFLTEHRDRVAYVRQVARSVKPGGHVIVATFGPEGPMQCSGLPVMRYDAQALHAEFGAHFRLVEHLTEAHPTPAGEIQQFIYCYCNVTGAPD
jgi:2-polyprenyl-3-methyl-5-hydroxy-6-metoxy-1,4-benzoquinol methylase